MVMDEDRDGSEDGEKELQNGESGGSGTSAFWSLRNTGVSGQMRIRLNINLESHEI